MINKYIRVTWVMIKNAYIRDSKISGYVLNRILVQFIEIAIFVVFFKIIFSNTQELAGWNYWQVMFLYFYSRFIMLSNNTLFKKGFTKFATTAVRKGEYDYYLIKPINPMYLMSISNPQSYIIISALAYLLLAIYCLAHGGMAIYLSNVLWFIFLSINGFFLYYFLNILTIVPTFWFIRLYSLKDIIYKTNHFMRYPVGIFPNFLKLALMVFFPIAAVSYIPAATLFYPPKLIYIIYMVLITVVFGFMANIFWKFGQKHYSSASS